MVSACGPVKTGIPDQVGRVYTVMIASTTPSPIDPRGPRFNQSVLAISLLVGFVFQWPIVAPIFAVVLLLGAAFGAAGGAMFAQAVAPVQRILYLGVVNVLHTLFDVDALKALRLGGRDRVRDVVRLQLDQCADRPVAVADVRSEHHEGVRVAADGDRLVRVRAALPEL